MAPTRLAREALVRVLTSRRWHAVDLGSACKDTATRVVTYKPRIVLLDGYNEEAKEFARVVAGRLPGGRIIVIVNPDRAEDIIQFADAGVAAFVPQDASLSQLISVMKPCADSSNEGPFLFMTALLRALREVTGHSYGPDHSLPPRQKQIVHLIERGLSNKEIADYLGIGLGTVKTHVHRLLQKLEVAGRVEAVSRVRNPKGHSPSRDSHLPRDLG